MSTAKTVEEILKDTKIYQILRPKLVHATPTLPLREALQLMQREKTGYIIIVDEHLKAVGVFTEREVLMKVMKKGVSMDSPVSEYMRTDVHTLSKSATVGDALNAMNEFSIRHIPLVDEFGQLNGVLSIRTIVTFLGELFPTEVLNLPPKPQIPRTVEGG